jgi:hypothetical protein
VLLSKSELANEATKIQFEQWVNNLFPAKRFVGLSERGMLSSVALSPPNADVSFSFLRAEQRHPHVHEITVKSRNGSLNGVAITSRAHRYLDRDACGWVLPVGMMFDLKKLQQDIASHQLFGKVERFKAALRTGIDRWHLLQRWGNQFESREITWRNDSRVEVQMQENATANWDKWDEWIASIMER